MRNTLFGQPLTNNSTLGCQPNLGLALVSAIHDFVNMGNAVVNMLRPDNAPGLRSL